MAGTIFINYRREDSASTAGRLCDRMAHAFGRNKIFMDVDHIPAGVDFIAHLNKQVAACNVLLVVIGSKWLDARDDANERRIDQADDFVAIEIAAALARDIRVIPVLVDEARLPRASELPDTLKPLARRQAVEVRQNHFGRDADALVERVREALAASTTPPAWRRKAVTTAGAATAMICVGWLGLLWIWDPQGSATTPPALNPGGPGPRSQPTTIITATPKGSEAEQSLNTVTRKIDTQTTSDQDAMRKAQEAEKQRVAALKAEEERKAKATAEADAKRKAEEAEKQRLAAVKAEQAHKLATYSALLTEGRNAAKKYDYDKAAGAFTAALQLNLDDATAFYERATLYRDRSLFDQSISDFDQAIRLKPTNANAFSGRCAVELVVRKLDQAIADCNEAIRLDSRNVNGLIYRGAGFIETDHNSAISDLNNAILIDNKSYAAFYYRGMAHLRSGAPKEAATDFDEAIRLVNEETILDGSNARTLVFRGLAHMRKREYDRAISDFSEAIRLNPSYAAAFVDRANAYTSKKEYSRAIADSDEALRLYPKYAGAFCNRGRSKRALDAGSDSAAKDIAKANELGLSSCK